MSYCGGIVVDLECCVFLLYQVTQFHERVVKTETNGCNEYVPIILCTSYTDTIAFIVIPFPQCVGDIYIRRLLDVAVQAFDGYICRSVANGDFFLVHRQFMAFDFESTDKILYIGHEEIRARHIVLRVICHVVWDICSEMVVTREDRNHEQEHYKSENDIDNHSSFSFLYIICMVFFVNLDIILYFHCDSIQFAFKYIIIGVRNDCDCCCFVCNDERVIMYVEIMMHAIM